MVVNKVLFVLGCLLHVHSTLGVMWSCSQDSDCSSMAGSVCAGSECVCPWGTQAVLGGSTCVDLAPYYYSTCQENFQCSRLFTSFECRRPGSNSSEAGNCMCQSGSHYFRGRCWSSIPLGEQCTRDEECQGPLRDPFSMTCNGTCQCADGYYFRQRGECRKMGLAVGDSCVLDQDCHFEGGACGLITLQCYDTNAAANTTSIRSTSEPSLLSHNEDEVLSRNGTLSLHGEPCDNERRCIESLECSRYGVCVCPTGYYPNQDASLCLAELGSPATSASQCVGFFTEIRDGVCTCQANFYFAEDMRTCVKASRLITDSCTVDDNCLTFGVASRCGEPQQWGLRSCECILEDAVWDAARSMCRLFSGLGEICDLDSDCLAGDLEIQCVPDEAGQGRCSCPPGFIAVDGLCLTFGLELGDACQVSAECTGSANSVCEDGQCTCGAGYQQVADFCAPSVGGTCTSNSDCVTDNTVCTGAGTCQCNAGFVEYQAVCWPASDGFGSPCNVSEQCSGVLTGSDCVSGYCGCAPSHHFRDRGCWPRTGLFEPCSRTSECYLETNSERVQCRNSLCQCSFEYPFSEELRTCGSSATAIFGNTMVIISALMYLYS